MGTDRHRLARLAIAFAVLPALACGGCAGRGLLFTRTVEPYSTDFNATRSGDKSCRVAEHAVREPVSGAYVSVRFTWRVLQEVARESGMTNFCYADIETLSILNGMYERRTLILCGE
jgi:hypothetical protein